MEINDLDKILKEIPILIVPDISFKRGDKTFKAEGMAIQKHRAENNKKANEYYKNSPERRKKNSVRTMTRHFHNKEKKECEKCKSTENLEFHHPEPYNVERFQILCRKCHQEETSKQIPKMESIFN